jgi:hypothetical protein
MFQLSAFFQPKITDRRKEKKVFSMALPNHREDFKNRREDFSKPSRRLFYVFTKTFLTIMMFSSFPAESRLKHLISGFRFITQLFTAKLKAERWGEKVV